MRRFCFEVINFIQEILCSFSNVLVVEGLDTFLFLFFFQRLCAPRPRVATGQRPRLRKTNTKTQVMAPSILSHKPLPSCPIVHAILDFTSFAHVIFTLYTSHTRSDWKCRTWKWRTIEIARGGNARHESAGHKIAGHENAGLKSARHENRWHETIAYLLWSCRVLVRNAVIWCSMVCCFCTLGLMFFFCIVCVCHKNYRYRYR